MNLETIRYYERIGLMPCPGRSAGGHRLYDQEHLRRLSFIRRARELGFGTDAIRTLLALAASEGKVTCEEVRLITAAHLEQVRGKIRDLARLEGVLAATVKQCPGGTSPDCPVLEALGQSHPG